MRSIIPRKITNLLVRSCDWNVIHTPLMINRKKKYFELKKIIISYIHWVTERSECMYLFMLENWKWKKKHYSQLHLQILKGFALWVLFRASQHFWASVLWRCIFGFLFIKQNKGCRSMAPAPFSASREKLLSHRPNFIDGPHTGIFQMTTLRNGNKSQEWMWWNYFFSGVI